MHMNHFIVIRRRHEWVVTYAERHPTSFPTREEAECYAFNAADLLASDGHAVSVLIMPDGLDSSEGQESASGRASPQC